MVVHDPATQELRAGWYVRFRTSASRPVPLEAWQARFPA